MIGRNWWLKHFFPPAWRSTKSHWAWPVWTAYGDLGTILSHLWYQFWIVLTCRYNSLFICFLNVIAKLLLFHAPWSPRRGHSTFDVTALDLAREAQQRPRHPRAPVTAGCAMPRPLPRRDGRGWGVDGASRHHATPWKECDIRIVSIDVLVWCVVLMLSWEFVGLCYTYI